MAPRAIRTAISVRPGRFRAQPDLRSARPRSTLSRARPVVPARCVTAVEIALPALLAPRATAPIFAKSRPPRFRARPGRVSASPPAPNPLVRRAAQARSAIAAVLALAACRAPLAITAICARRRPRRFLAQPGRTSASRTATRTLARAAAGATIATALGHARASPEPRAGRALRLASLGRYLAPPERKFVRTPPATRILARAVAGTVIAMALGHARVSPEASAGRAPPLVSLGRIPAIRERKFVRTPPATRILARAVAGATTATALGHARASPVVPVRTAPARTGPFRVKPDLKFARFLATSPPARAVAPLAPARPAMVVEPAGVPWACRRRRAGASDGTSNPGTFPTVLPARAARFNLRRVRVRARTPWPSPM